MRTKLLLVLGATLLLGVRETSPLAHHAFSAEFDATKPITCKGVVTKVEWTNPHVWIHVDVRQPDGTVENWAFEAGTPSVLFRRGFTKEALLPGTPITVDGYRAKDGTKKANGRDLLFADGRKMFIGSTGTGAPPSDQEKK